MNANWVWKHLSVALLASCLGLTALAQHTQETSSNSIEAEANTPDVSPVDDDRLDRALAAYDAESGLQRERPEWEPEPRDRDEFRNREPNGFIRAIAQFFEAIGGVLGYMLAAIIVVAIIAGLYMVFGESLSFRRRQTEKTAAPDISSVPDLRPEAKRARALLEDADALAAEGRFAEAVHLLLFRSIDEIQEQKSGIIGRSLTAREIGALGVLPDWIRQALLPIIRIVERSFFGGQDVTEAGWREARASYETFAFGEAWT
ncbi:MAG: hypothetical protein AAGJ68_12825 [Pseudomonadota bacterium]